MGAHQVSSAINAAHAWDAGPQSWQGAVGAALAGIFPLMTLAAAHVVVDVAFAARPDAVTATDADTATVADTVAATEADTKTTSASAGQADADAVVGELAPVELVVKSTPELLHTMDSKTADTRTDGGYPDGVRRIRTAARGRVAERLDEIDRLALKTDLSGRAIADELGLARRASAPGVRGPGPTDRHPDTGHGRRPARCLGARPRGVNDREIRSLVRPQRPSWRPRDARGRAPSRARLHQRRGGQAGETRRVLP